MSTSKTSIVPQSPTPYQSSLTQFSYKIPSHGTMIDVSYKFSYQENAPKSQAKEAIKKNLIPLVNQVYEKYQNRIMTNIAFSALEMEKYFFVNYLVTFQNSSENPETGSIFNSQNDSSSLIELFKATHGKDSAVSQEDPDEVESISPAASSSNSSSRSSSSDIEEEPRNSRTEKMLSDLTTANAQLKSQLEERNSQLQAAGNLNTHLNTQLQETAQKTQAQMENLQKQLQDLQAQNDQQAKTIAEQAAQLKEKEQTQTALQASLKEQTQQLEQSQKSLASSDQRLDTSQQRIRENAEERQKMSLAMEAMEKHRQDIEQSNKQLLSEKQADQQRITELEQELEQLQAAEKIREEERRAQIAQKEEQEANQKERNQTRASSSTIQQRAQQSQNFMPTVISLARRGQIPTFPQLLGLSRTFSPVHISRPTLPVAPTTSESSNISINPRVQALTQAVEQNSGFITSLNS